eukprot:CAMPEP_0116877982 /NCGR_PEP_ID=MMETSP0463-20121206/9738_1 /TAXON_ID=181622 /ORGANISM="Strombidinopsis sp, Strain SopsisLIS2011" /LENGTH=56 /DNA_ID=CAMNT_0004525759 /DNA_START=140 /DNA_END=310 /DNA_ORIENTATION=-
MDPDTWAKEKADGNGMDFPNLPYWHDGSYKLTETPAIHEYLAARYHPELLGRTPEE